MATYAVVDLGQASFGGPPRLDHHPMATQQHPDSGLLDSRGDAMSQKSTGTAIQSEEAAAPPAPPAQPPLAEPRRASTRRRGCQHCVTCSGLKHHYHSTTVRSAESPTAEWWPGGINSPVVYYHLRARQLRHQCKYPARAGASWRLSCGVNSTPSAMLAKRTLPPLSVQVPESCTNVALGDKVVYVGQRIMPLGLLPIPSAAVAAADEVTSRRATMPADTSCSGDFMQIDPKRRCTDTTAGDAATTLPLLAPGHFIARATPLSATQPKAYPGIVVMQQLAQQPCAPAPLSAASDASTSSAAQMSTGSDGSLLPRRLSWGNGMEAEAPLPVLLPLWPGAAEGDDDPTMQQYFRKQYNIKQEQAYQVIDITASQPTAASNTTSTAVEEASSGWASMLRSLAGSLKRSLSP